MNKKEKKNIARRTWRGKEKNENSLKQMRNGFHIFISAQKFISLRLVVVSYVCEWACVWVCSATVVDTESKWNALECARFWKSYKFPLRLYSMVKCRRRGCHQMNLNRRNELFAVIFLQFYFCSWKAFHKIIICVCVCMCPCARITSKNFFFSNRGSTASLSIPCKWAQWKKTVLRCARTHKNTFHLNVYDAETDIKCETTSLAHWWWLPFAMDHRIQSVCRDPLIRKGKQRATAKYKRNWKTYFFFK